MSVSHITLADLKPGESAVIKTVHSNHCCLRLLEMGFLPGEPVKVDSIAPLGDPLAVTIGGYKLGIRKAEAAAIEVVPQS